MHPIHALYPLSACALAATLLVAACGGGDATPPPSIAGSTGFAVDDYLSGATVICDTNGNGKVDTGEVSVTTDSSGFFKFSPACTATISVTGGINIDTKLPFTGTLKAPAGSTVVTPLTTLMAEGMTNDQVIAALGLSVGTDLKTVDPARKITGQLVNPDLMRKTLVLQQILQKTTESLAGLAASGGDAAKSAVYSEVAAAVAATLKTSTALVRGTASSSDAITAMVTAAIQRVAASTTLASAVVAGAKSVNPTAMAQVIAGSLKVQADAILNATESSLIATTKLVQSDTLIVIFVKTNAAALAAAPGAATSALAATLTAAVTQSTTGSSTPTTPTAPIVEGTLIASFDESTPLVVLGFEGADGSYIDDTPPAGGGTGKALHIVRSGTVVYAGVVVTVPTIPFASNRKTLTARVYSPKAGIPFVLKTEYSQGNGTGETQATAAVTVGWQTLSWVMADVDVTKAYSRIVILPQLGTATGSGIADNYFVDNVALAPAPAVTPPIGVEASCATAALQCIGFAESTIGTDSFGGLAASIANDPVTGASNKVLKIIKGPPNEPWAGTTIFTSAAAKSIDRAGFATSKSVTMRSYSGAAVGTKITLKFENSIDPNIFLIAQAVTTSQNAWETLTFNFATPTNGVYNAAAVYDKASILPAWSETGGTQPALTASTTFYFDELTYAVAVATPVPTPTPTPTPSGTVLLNFDNIVPTTIRDQTGIGATTTVTTTPPTGGGTGSALDVLRSGGEVYALAVLDVPAIPFTTTRKTLSARVYSPTAGIPMKIKLETTGATANSGDVAANETVVVGWQTLTWTFTSIDPTLSWTAIVLLPNIGTVDAPPGKHYYFDDITLSAATSTPTPTPTTTPIMAAGFNAANTTTNGGVWGTYAGDGGVTSGSGGGFADTNPAATPNYIYSYTQLSSASPAAYSYQGIYFQPPSTATVSAVSKTALNYTMGVNPEWFNASGGAKFVILISANVPGVSTATCDPKVSAVVQATSASAVAYSTPLSAFTGIAQNCGVASATVASILAGAVKQISFEADGGGASLAASGLNSNTNRSVAASGVFTTTLSVSPPIAFQ